MRRMTFAVAWVVFALVAHAPTAHAQTESALRGALEGRSVTTKIDMPATAKGVDIFPRESAPVDWREVANRLKDNGTALRPGQQSMITKVVVKRDHIEVQLGGGGYGTFGDNTGSAVSYSDQGESVRERTLRDSIKTATGDTKKRMQTELDNARSRRERENVRDRAIAAQANEAREANLRVKRAEAGSRFNIWYKGGIAESELTSDAVMLSLAPYAELAGAPSTGPRNPAGGAPLPTPPYTTNAMLAVRKGLTVPEVESLFGPATTASERKEGTLTVVTRNYLYDGKKVITSFVNGVLIDYVIAPQ